MPFTGGAFYSCSTVEVSTVAQQLYTWDAGNLLNRAGLGNSGLPNSRNSLQLIPFHGGDAADANIFAGSVVHAEVGGSEWYSSHVVTNDVSYPHSEYMILGYREAAAMRKVSESTVNGMPNLIPFNLRVRGYDNNFQPIGSLENIRFSQIGLMNFGQVESDGTDSWKFYPVYLKDADDANGGIDHTGTMGLAIRYDGP